MPERTCIVCRGKAEKFELLRFVLQQPELPTIGFDLRQLRPGRGVYCHPQLECLGSENLRIRASMSSADLGFAAVEPKSSRVRKSKKEIRRLRQSSRGSHSSKAWIEQLVAMLELELERLTGRGSLKVLPRFRQLLEDLNRWLREIEAGGSGVGRGSSGKATSVGRLRL